MIDAAPFCGVPMNFNRETGDIFGWHEDDCFFCWLEEDERDMTNEEIVAAFIAAWNRRSGNDQSGSN